MAITEYTNPKVMGMRDVTRRLPLHRQLLLTAHLLTHSSHIIKLANIHSFPPTRSKDPKVSHTDSPQDRMWRQTRQIQSRTKASRIDRVYESLRRIGSSKEKATTIDVEAEVPIGVVSDSLRVIHGKVDDRSPCQHRQPITTHTTHIPTTHTRGTLTKPRRRCRTTIGKLTLKMPALHTTLKDIITIYRKASIPLKPTINGTLLRHTSP